MPKINYHIHSTYSDGQDSMQEICKKAKELGLEEIAFTDHYNPRWKLTPDFDKQLGEIENFRKEFSPLIIKLGVEMDYFNGKDAELKKVIDSHPFDFVMGAIHYLDGLSFMFYDGLKECLVKAGTPEKFYNDYFKAVNEAVKSGLFDVMAHLDVVRWFENGYTFFDETRSQGIEECYNTIPFDVYKDKALDIVKALKETNIGFELNTGGYSKKFLLNDSCPSFELLMECKKAGIEKITIGSDCHELKEVNEGLDKGLEKLKRAGYDKMCTFSKRVHSFVEI